MAIPGLFSPVREGEHVYVDGGLVGNMPTDVVRDMGADIVIGVHLETSPARPTRYNRFSQFSDARSTWWLQETKSADWPMLI